MSDAGDSGLVLPPREPAAPPTQDDEAPPDRLSFIFRTRTLAELVSVSRYNKVVWRQSDNILIKSFLAFYRLSLPDIKCLNATPSTKTIRCQVDAAGPQQRPCQGPNSPDLHQLAAWMNIDLPSLTNNEWAAVSAKLISSLEYTVGKVAKEHCLATYWDAEVEAYRLRWPDELRRTWLHPHWKGDMDSRLPGSAAADVPRNRPPRAPAEDQGYGQRDAAAQDQPRVAHARAAVGSAGLSTPPLSPLSTWQRPQINPDQAPPPRNRPPVLLTPPGRGPARHQAHPACTGLFPLTPPGSSRLPNQRRRQRDGRDDDEDDDDNDDDDGDGEGWRPVDFGSPLPLRPAWRPGNGSQPPPQAHPLLQSQRARDPPPPRRLPMAGPAGGAQPVGEAMIDAILRYNTATQELVNVSINEMTARLNLHKALFQHAPDGRGPPRRVLTPQQRADCARALISSLVADADDGRAASHLPLPAEGDLGPLRRLVKLQTRRRDLVTQIRGLARSVHLVDAGAASPLRIAGGVDATAWHHLMMAAWVPEMRWVGLTGPR